MKMFVWEDPYDVNWGTSLFIGVAETPEEAWACVKAERPNDARGKYRAPDRERDLPCGEWMHWEE